MSKDDKKVTDKTNNTTSTARDTEAGTTSSAGMVWFRFGIFSLSSGILLLATYLIMSTISITIAVLVGVIAAWSIRVVPQWQNCVVLRFGKFNRVSTPGICMLIPFVESTAARVDQRITTSAFNAEAALTADLVAIDVDAVIFWVVWDSQKACMEVRDYRLSVLYSAQTAIRDVIGRLSLADISIRRKQIDKELEDILGAKCQDWGVSVISVEIRDIKIPSALQDALSKEAQAERERNARVILAEVERDISEMFVEAADVYDKNPNAMKLRAMNLAYEGAKDSKGVMLAPSSLADGFVVNK